MKKVWEYGGMGVGGEGRAAFPRRLPIRTFCLTALMLAVCLLMLARCDTVSPEAEGLLVVEGFLDAGRPLPVLQLRQTRGLGTPSGDVAHAPISDAAVVLTLEGKAVPYDPVPDEPGAYRPAAASGAVPPGAAFALTVRWREQQARTQGVVPPPITIDSIRVEAPARPVQAVLLDSLRLDSLGVGVEQGFLYPVEVRVWWTGEEPADTLHWVRTQLKPYTSFSSTFVDFFLRPGQILREHTIPADAQRRRAWTGVYAVPVAHEAAPLPPHGLKVSLLRSGPDYARFASSRDAPERREPVSNLQGAIGIFAGISVDSVRVEVR